MSEISLEQAMLLNAKWHSVLPQTDKDNLTRVDTLKCYGADFNGTLYAVAIWTNPVARLLPYHTTLELRRLAIPEDAPKNTASRMLRIMRMLIHKTCPYIKTLISYQDTEAHTGGIYKAAGWKAVSTSQDGEWNRPSRKRKKAQSAAPKVRWELNLAS